MESFTVDGSGTLVLGGLSAARLAAEFGTPLYVYEEDKIRCAMRLCRDTLKQYCGAAGKVYYASKAFCCKEIYRVAAQEGIGADVVSGGELATALAAGFDPAQTCFHGNNKTPDELADALRCGVGQIVVDNLTELAVLDRLAGQMGLTVPISMRIKPGVEAHTHEYVKTGQIDSKFGFALENGEAEQGVLTALSEHTHLRLIGLHAHIGSQIFETEPYVETLRILLAFLAGIKRKTGHEIQKLCLGGGFGIRYTAEDTPPDYAAYFSRIAEVLSAECARLSLTVPAVAVEPGRSIVGEAGTTLYTIGNVKEIKGVRNYVAIDGGMTDNPRFALYGSKYSITVANKADRPKDYCASIAGKCCESGDLIGVNLWMQKPSAGDLLAVFSTGAYNYSMASNYNRIPRPAVVFVRDGKARLVVKRETQEDLFRLDI